MSLFDRSMAAVPARRLDHRTLLTLLRTLGRPQGDAARPDEPRAGACGDPARPCIASVILGRPGWRDAARALGGSFALPDPERRQPR